MDKTAFSLKTYQYLSGYDEPNPMLCNGGQYTITKCWGSRAEYNIDHPRYVRWKEAELISKNELVKNIINDL